MTLQRAPCGHYTMNRFTSEFLGTFFLCILVLIGNPFGVGIGLAALVWALGPVSGAQFNPAVTFSQRVHGAITVRWSLAYVGAQLLAATSAALVTALMVGHNPEKLTEAPAGVPDAWISALSAELLGTLLLVFVILAVANSRRTAGNSYAALAIGGTVFAAGSAFGDFSAFLNPAVTWAFGLHDLVAAFRAEQDTGKAVAVELLRFGAFAPWALCLVAAQLAGALLATGCFRLTHPEDCGAGRT